MGLEAGAGDPDHGEDDVLDTEVAGVPGERGEDLDGLGRVVASQGRHHHHLARLPPVMRGQPLGPEVGNVGTRGWLRLRSFDTGWSR